MVKSILPITSVIYHMSQRNAIKTTEDVKLIVLDEVSNLRPRAGLQRAQGSPILNTRWFMRKAHEEPQLPPEPLKEPPGALVI